MKLKRLLLTSALALSFVVSAPTQAKADPVSAAIVTFIGFTGTAATVATFVINSALYASASWAIGKAAQLLSSSKSAVAERQASVTTLSLGETPRELLVGQACTGGSLVDAFNFGGKYGTDTVSRCIALVDHEVAGIVGYYVDDQYYTWVASGVQPGFNGKLSIDFRNARDVGWMPPQHVVQNGGWSSSDRLCGITHVWIDTRTDDQVWSQGHPRFRFVLNGLKAYDPRKDASLGYTGPNPHVWEDVATHEFTRNAEVLRYNFQRGIYATGRHGQAEHLLLGRGLSAEEAPPHRIIAAANLCDEVVQGEARYTVSGVISAIQSFIEVEEMFAAAMAGVIVQRDGGVEVEPGQAKAASVTITDADLVADEPVTFAEFQPDTDGGRINTVVPRYVEPAQGYKDHGGPPRRDLADIQEDGGPREMTLPLMLVTSARQSDACAEIARRRARLERRATIVLPPDYAEIEEGDWVAWKSDRYHDGATVRYQVTSYSLDEKWRQHLSLEEIAASVFGVPDPVENRADPPPPPTPIDALALDGVVAEAVTLAAEDVASSAGAVPAVRFSWDLTGDIDAAVRAIRAEVRVQGTGDVAATRTEAVSSGVLVTTNGVGPNQTLECRLIPIGDDWRPVVPSVWMTVVTGNLVAGGLTDDVEADLVGRTKLEVVAGLADTVALAGVARDRVDGLEAVFGDTVAAAASAAAAADSETAAGEHKVLAVQAGAAAAGSHAAAVEQVAAASQRADEASISAQAAAAERVGARVEREAAGVSAGAAVVAADRALASETAAEQSAAAASTAKTLAETARGQAQTFASNASTSANNAAGSAAMAATQAGLATTAKNDASGFAAAASGSASTATSKATEAQISAASVAAAQTSASIARDQALAALAQQGRLNLVQKTRVAGETMVFHDTASGWGYRLHGGVVSLRFSLVGSLKQNTLYSVSFKARRVAGNSTAINAALFPETLPAREFSVASLDWVDCKWEGITSSHPDILGFDVQLRFFRAGLPEHHIFDVTDIKLEEGATSTAWTPNPRDIEYSASAAATSSSNAAASETAAGAAASAAQGSATNAATAEGGALTYAGQASTSAAAAQAASISAGTSAANAAAGAAAASASAATAIEQASNASASAVSAAISADLAAGVRVNPNLLPNGSGENGTFGWAGGEYFASQEWPLYGGRVLKKAFLPGPAAAYILSPAAIITGGARFTLSWRGWVENFWGPMLVYLAWYDSSLTYIGESSPRIPLNATVKSCTDTAPAGAVYARAVIYIEGEALQGGAAVWNSFKLEAGDKATAYNATRDAIDLRSSLNITAATTADLESRMASARFEVTAAAGGDPAQLKIRADESGSLAQLVATAIAFGNNVAGSVVKVMEIVGGVVHITNKLLLGAAGQIELDPAYPLILWRFGAARLAIGQLPQDNLFFWFGSGSRAITAMRKNNARVWFDTSADGYWGGSIIAGTLSNSVAGSNTVVPATVTLGPFATNGGPITVVWSYDYSRTGERWDDQTGAITGSPAATIRLYRRLGAGAWGLVDTMTVYGDCTATYEAEPVPGQPAGTVGRTYFTDHIGGSRTYTDNAGGTEQRSYRVEVVSRTVSSVPGLSAALDAPQQYYAITSSE